MDKFLENIPENVGVSSKRIQRIKAKMQQYVDEKQLPGIVTLVARKSRIIHFEAFGYKEIETQSPMTIDTIFRLASMTKPITSVAFMTLYEEGHVSLSDLISKWIPEFKDSKLAVQQSKKGGTNWKLIPAKRPIRIRQLLTHTAGFQREGNLLGVTAEEFAEVDRQKPNETIGDFVRHYAKLPLRYNPGEAWQYSRSTCVLGYLIELISGMTLDKFLEEKIFNPLKMKDTHFYLPLEKLDRLSALYNSGENDELQLSDPATENSTWVKKPHIYFKGSSGLLSTTGDYYNFCDMLLNGGVFEGERILGRKTVDWMSQNHIGDLPVYMGPMFGFGLGWGFIKDTEQYNTLDWSFDDAPISRAWTWLPWSPGTITWAGAHCTLFWVDPKEQLTGILMSQRSNYHRLIWLDFVNLVYQSIIK